MCGWNIHSSPPERQNFSTLLVSFTPEMNLLSPRTISFSSTSQVPRKCSVSLSLSSFFFTFLYFHGVKTEANGPNSKVTGVALFHMDQRQRSLFSVEKKNCHTILMEFYPAFDCAAFSISHSATLAKSADKRSFLRRWHWNNCTFTL